MDKQSRKYLISDGILPLLNWCEESCAKNSHEDDRINLAFKRIVLLLSYFRFERDITFALVMSYEKDLGNSITPISRLNSYIDSVPHPDIVNGLSSLVTKIINLADDFYVSCKLDVAIKGKSSSEEKVEDSNYNSSKNIEKNTSKLLIPILTLKRLLKERCGEVIF
jgi:hypothetical protein